VHVSTTCAKVGDAPANWRHERWALAHGYRIIAGLDEAGRGPWAGPVVAAAVVVRKPLFQVRIDDSKRLSPHQRLRAYTAIWQQAHVGVGLASHAAIDATNILIATQQAMRHALANLRITPHFVLVDGIIPQLTDMPQRCLIAGERQSLSIACASIVAKVTRDHLMAFYHRLFPVYEFARHKGYGTALHRHRLQRFGPSPLHRLSFRPVTEWAG